MIGNRFNFPKPLHPLHEAMLQRVQISLFQQIPIYGPADAVSKGVTGNPTESSSAFSKVCGPTVHTNGSIQLLLNVFWFPLHAIKDLVNQTEDGVMHICAYIHYVKPFKGCSRECHANNSVLHIREIPSLETVTPNRKGVEMCRSFRYKRYYGVTFVLTFAIRSKYPTGDSRDAKLLAKRTELKFAH
jgi:hypothetical protein